MTSIFNVAISFNAHCFECVKLVSIKIAITHIITFLILSERDSYRLYSAWISVHVTDTLQALNFAEKLSQNWIHIF